MRDIELAKICVDSLIEQFEAKLAIFDENNPNYKPYNAFELPLVRKLNNITKIELDILRKIKTCLQ